MMPSLWTQYTASATSCRIGIIRFSGNPPVGLIRVATLPPVQCSVIIHIDWPTRRVSITLLIFFAPLALRTQLLIPLPRTRFGRYILVSVRIDTLYEMRGLQLLTSYTARNTFSSLSSSQWYFDFTCAGIPATRFLHYLERPTSE